MKAFLYFSFVILLGFALDGCAALKGFREFDNKPVTRDPLTGRFSISR